MNLTGLARSLAVGIILMGTPLSAGEETVSFTRSGQDLLSAASFGSSEDLAFAYDASFGQMTRIQGSAYSLSLTSDPLLHLPLAQTIFDALDEVLLTAAITYDAGGLRANRTLSADLGGSTTSYWYGGDLHPLVVERDGVTYRLIGKGVVEALAGSQLTRSYAHADHLGSTRMVTDDQGKVVQSLGYDTDYGLTRIAGQSTAATDDSMASFYRFQGQEQEIFPLTKLGIANDALASWLDQIQLYHFPWRDYAAGFAAFTQTDPIPTEDSLYSALAANPVNVTDATGGMLQLDEPRYTPAHRQISASLQGLLDRLLQDPSVNFEFDEIVALSDLRLKIVAQRVNRNNPFAPDGALGKRRLETYLGHVEVTDQRRRDAEQAFRILRREQDRWLAAYSRPIGQLWERMNAGLGRNKFGEPVERSGADEDEKGQDNAIPQGPADAQLPSANNEISVRNMPVQNNQLNDDYDRKEEEHEEEHGDEELRNNDKPCCNIL